MHNRYRSSYRRYPTYRSRARRGSDGFFAPLTWFLMDLLTGIFLVIVALLCVFVLFALLTHLHQVEALCSQISLLVSTYGPLMLLLATIIAACFLVLGTVYGIVKVLAAISETLSHASLARARVRQVHARVPSYAFTSAQTVPLPKIRLR